jgi:hypothetical protein
MVRRKGVRSLFAVSRGFAWYFPELKAPDPFSCNMVIRRKGC